MPLVHASLLHRRRLDHAGIAVQLEIMYSDDF